MVKTKKPKLCLDDIKCEWDHDSSFKRSKKYALDLDIKDSDSLILEEECNLLEPRYISHHLMSATVFFVYLAIAGFIVTFLHEAFQATFYILSGYDYGRIEITIDSGTIFANVPTNASFWWYLLVFIGPSIFVEGLILLLLVFRIKYDVKPVFLDGVRSSKIQTDTIIKAFGWFCSVKLVAMILVFPISSLIYDLIGEFRTSDITIAWSSTIYYLSDPLEIVLTQLLIVISSAILLSISTLYIFSIKRTATVV